MRDFWDGFPGCLLVAAAMFGVGALLGLAVFCLTR